MATELKKTDVVIVRERRNALGLAAVDTYAQATKGVAFADLSVDGQDAVLREMGKEYRYGFRA